MKGTSRSSRARLDGGSRSCVCVNVEQRPEPVPVGREQKSGYAQVFGRRHDRLSTRAGGRRPKSAKARNRGGGLCGGGAAGYGELARGRELKVRRFATAIRLEREYNLNVTAQILPMGNSRFVPSMISTS